MIFERFRSNRQHPHEVNTPLTGVAAVFADLDGVVYKGKLPIDFAVDSLQQVAETLPVGYITNNASRTPEAVAEQLRGFGLSVSPEHVVTSPQAAAQLLTTLVTPGAKVFVVGGTAIEDQLRDRGFEPTRDSESEPAAVIQGFHPTVSWKELAEAAFLVQEGAVWVATNTDWTMPVERGIAPGNGTLVSAVHTAAGPLATVAGKPEVPIFAEALNRFGVQEALMIGDRLDTDIMGAKRAGIRSALVLTGIDGPKQVLAAGPEQQPDYILNDLRELHLPYPEVHRFEHQGHPVVQVGNAAVALVNQTHVEILAKDENDPTQLLRAACELIWPTGRAIFGFYVDEEIFNYR